MATPRNSRNISPTMLLRREKVSLVQCPYRAVPLCILLCIIIRTILKFQFVLFRAYLAKQGALNEISLVAGNFTEKLPKFE